jgi:ABC-type multidrug transport system permease subunit
MTIAESPLAAQIGVAIVVASLWFGATCFVYGVHPRKRQMTRAWKVIFATIILLSSFAALSLYSSLADGGARINSQDSMRCFR